MKTNCLLFLFLFLFSINTYAQSPEFKITSFTQQDNNLAARVNKRLDDNDEPCALVLVRTAETGLGFTASSGVVGNVDWKNGDYRLYVSAGNRSIKIFKKGIQTIDYVLPIIPKSSETYLLKLKVVRPKPKVAILPVTIITTPGNANLSIDGKKVDSQTKNHKLTEGTHNITLAMPGYKTLQKAITVNDNNVYFNLKLNRISNAALMIESEPAGADVYLDGVKLGQTPVSAFYPPGTYPVRVEKEGYLTIEGENLTVTAPQTMKKYTLAENVGFLTINTYDAATVTINGKEYPDTKNIKLSPQLLTIKVTMPKAKAIEKQVVLKRNDTLSFNIFPKVPKGTLEVAVTPFDATIELTGDAGGHYTATGMHIFRDIPIGQYTVKVKAKGYRTETKSVSLTAHQVLNQSIKLQKGPSGDIEMVFVKGGTFRMGSPKITGGDDEHPRHKVTVDDFYIGKYEVTQRQWKAIMGNNLSYFNSCDNCPVEQVTWNDVQKFIKKLSEKTGQHYRLPTEAEWEYAARGGNQSRGYKYAGSNNIHKVAWYRGNSDSKTHPVGQKQPNELGIYDMTGNVVEWCNDWYDEYYYSNSPQNNPQGPLSGSGRVGRGGSWGDNPRGCRVAYRNYFDPDYSHSDVGFRLALAP